jgi:hypothetical protein
VVVVPVMWDCSCVALSEYQDEMWLGDSLPVNLSSGDLAAGVTKDGIAKSDSGGRLAAMAREDSGSGLGLVRNTSGLRLPISSAVA